MTLSEESKLLNGQYWSEEHERTIKWNDPEINIKWPKLHTEYIVSDKTMLLKVIININN